EADRRVESLLPGDVVEKLGELLRHTLLHRFLENRAPPAIQSFDGDSVLDRGPEQSGTAEVGVLAAPAPTPFAKSLQSPSGTLLLALHGITGTLVILHVAPPS